MSTISKGQLRTLIGEFLLKGIPDDLSSEGAQEWIALMGPVMQRLLRFAPEQIAKALDQIWPFKRDRFLRSGFRVDREGPLCLDELDTRKLDVEPLTSEGEHSIDGKEIIARASDEARFPGCQGWGLHQAEEILKVARSLPTDFRAFRPVFPETILRNARGDRYIVYLAWNLGTGWYIDVNLLDGGFSSDYCLLRRRE